MKIIILQFTIYILVTLNCHSQLKGVIYCEETKKTIPYVNIWVENEDRGTTSDNNGFFSFKNDLTGKKLVITSIGYEKQVLIVNQPYIEIFLLPITYQLGDILIKPQRKKEISVGKYRKKDVDWVTGGDTPQIFTRFFPYKPEYDKTPFIKEIKIETVAKAGVYFQLRFFSVSADNRPATDILSKIRIIKVRGGHKTTTIELDETLIFPRNGIFAGFEVLTLDDNKFTGTYMDKKTDQIKEIVAYYPCFGLIESEMNENSWHYRMGNWYKEIGKLIDNADTTTIYNLAVELKLSN